MTAIDIVNAIRIGVIVGGFLILLYGLLIIPTFRKIPQFVLTTGLLALVVAAGTNEIDDLGNPFDFSLVASTCGIIFTGLGLILIRR
jgi:hypothetical protein